VSALNPEGCILSRGIQIDLFDMFDYCQGRAGSEIVFECLDACFRPLGQDFNSPISAVAHVANHLMSRGGALGEKTIAYSLHLTAYQKLSRHPV
jgi:hypothetical protein